TLALRGYMGTAPVRPSVAISFQTLEAYRQMHRVCPRLSIQAQVRALSHLHRVSRPHSSSQFSIAFDMYLDILHHVDLLVNAALHRDDPDWQIRNMCRPCMYNLEKEDMLSPSMFVTMDGNQSLKLIDGLFRSGTLLNDTRTARSTIWISPEKVDRFQDEPSVSSSTTAPPLPIVDDTDDDAEWFDIDDPSCSNPASVCVDRWRNAGPESRKRMFALFAVTGIFVSLCRHGHCLAICDMVCSGELMKYALAHVDRLMEIYGYNIKIAYDVACAFFKILLRSSLGPRVASLKVSGVVPAFHGHSHNRACQVDWHPLYQDGVGKEDFEGCECLFSESNLLAPGTRLSTVFHRHQAIEQFMGFWSEQKHADSGKFILDNYRQALDIIKTDGEALELLSQQLGVGPADFERYLQEERAYFKNRKVEPPEVTAELDYLDSLVRLQTAGYKQQQISSVRTKVRTTRSRWETIHEEVLRREEELNVVERWKPGDAKYDEMFRELGQRKYRLALDNLARLVVQRLFELTKLQLSGYKLREKIGKALKARADAIKKALSEYNACAAELSPPREELLWSDILDMSTLADFDLLRETRQDIRAKPWAKPSHRRAMNLYFNIKHAREEIRRLNVEIPRLFTSMLDDHADYHLAITASLDTNAPLANELRNCQQYQEIVSARIVKHLTQASRLSEFSGKIEAGRRVGRTPHEGSIPLPCWAALDLTSDTNTVETEHLSCIPGVETEREEEAFVDYVDSIGELP
ncbi:hypothetical protein C8Q77DRAFT_1065128, partial [Trametes polyzona]